jgi:hypothetical protein
MEEPSNKEIWMVDSTPLDMLVCDTQADRATVEVQSEQHLVRTQLIYTMDLCSRIVIAFRLSFEEEKTQSEH